jgi:hypothetical protein
MAKGKKYQLSFQARADQPRSLDVCVARPNAPRIPATVYRTVELRGDWQNFDLSFAGVGDADDNQISFRLGRSTVPIEIRRVQLLNDSGKEIIPQPLIVH